jgi:hypothetical protein
MKGGKIAGKETSHLEIRQNSRRKNSKRENKIIGKEPRVGKEKGSEQEAEEKTAGKNK